MKVITFTSGILLSIIMVSVLITFAACSRDEIPTLTTASLQKPAVATGPLSPSQVRPSGPFVQIISPDNAAALSIGSITIVIKVDEFKLTNNFEQTNVSGQGHVHYYMDIEPPTSPDQPAATVPGTFVESFSNSYAWKNVGSGDHKFSVQLVNNDHTPLNPPVTSMVSIRISAGAGMPALIIVSPRDGEVISGDSVTIRAQVANFNVVDKMGQSNAANEGHLMFYQDVEAPTIQGPQATTRPGSYVAVAGTSYTWQYLSQGTHSFSVQLVNNNNTPINPPVSAKITLTIK